MSDYMFKFDSCAAAEEALIHAGMIRHESGVVYHPAAAIDWIGELSTPIGEPKTTPDGAEYYDMAALDGFHVNVRTSDDGLNVGLAQIASVVTPSEPLRTWA